MLNSAFLYSFQSNKETENQMFKISWGELDAYGFRMEEEKLIFNMENRTPKSF